MFLLRFDDYIASTSSQSTNVRAGRIFPLFGGVEAISFTKPPLCSEIEITLNV